MDYLIKLLIVSLFSSSSYCLCSFECDFVYGLEDSLNSPLRVDNHSVNTKQNIKITSSLATIMVELNVSICSTRFFLNYPKEHCVYFTIIKGVRSVCNIPEPIVWDRTPDIPSTFITTLLHRSTTVYTDISCGYLTTNVKLRFQCWS